MVPGFPRSVRPVLFAAALALLGSAAAWAQSPAAAFGGTAERVGRGDGGRLVTPVNQMVTPFGKSIDLPGLRPQALALSPDGRTLVVSGKTSELLVLDPVTGVIRQRVALPHDRQGEPQPEAVSPNLLEPDKKGQVSFTGLVFSPNGRRIVLSNVNGNLKVFAVAADGTVSPSHSVPLPPADAPRRKEEVPSGLAFSADGRRLYVCANLSNQLLELDAASGRVLRAFPVGVAPYDVVLAAGKAYVSNWGGRRPGAGDLTGPAGRGTRVRVDAERQIANEGSVSVVPLVPEAGASSEVLAGLHASALAVAPNGRYVVCANAAADTLTVIDTRTDAVAETIWVKAKPGDPFGASPNALAFAPSGRRLYVANGTQNALAVVGFDPADRESKLEGLVPVGWFPGAVLFDARRRALVVANLKGLPAAKGRAPGGAPGYGSKQFSGSLSLVPEPTKDDLPKLSETVARNLRREAIAQSRLPARAGQSPRAIPERIGEPSRIRHVVYVIKENRTYDQVLGDLPQGNGDPSLCIFGERITPNQHRIARDFVLLDNTYCAGILSADGHQWSTTAFATDYLEKSFAGFPRSYPDGMGVDEDDALAYSPAGFLWDNALKHRVSLRNYGEFMAPALTWRDGRSGTPDFAACYRTWRGQQPPEVVFGSYPMVETLRGFSPAGYVGWGMEVPDQFRADFILRELREFEARGEFPALTLICLPNDHTSGTKKGAPTPAACMADNDLAFGRLVEGLSRSRFWKEMAIFAIEDDPQAGWDHVSGYRTTAYVASPYARRGAVVGTQYNTTSLIRTIEQILGLPPMNQFDASATPMFDCFTETPDFTPFTALPANVPLDQMNPDPVSIRDRALHRDALASAGMNFREIDRAPEDQLNRILWRAMKGPQAPYPEWAVRPDADED